MNIKRNIALSDSGFVFNPSTGDSFSTNPIGLEIIRLLQEMKTAEQVKKAILAQYLTDDATFEKDFYDFVNMLNRFNLMETEEKDEKATN